MHKKQSFFFHLLNKTNKKKLCDFMPMYGQQIRVDTCRSFDQGEVNLLINIFKRGRVEGTKASSIFVSISPQLLHMTYLPGITETWRGGGGGNRSRGLLPIVGYTWYSILCSTLEGRENCHFSHDKNGSQNRLQSERNGD